MRYFLVLASVVVLFGSLQYSFAASGVTLTAPNFVDATGQKIAAFNVGQEIGVASTLANHGSSEQKFTYLVQVMDNKGETDYLEGFSASMLSNQSFTASQVWIPKNPGQYTVQVFVWNSLSSAIPLTDVLSTQIIVS